MKGLGDFLSGSFLSSVFEQFVALFIALVTFFAFPVTQYFLLRRFARNKGTPLLWFLPGHGFRIVIGNIPSRRPLADLKIGVKIRNRIPRRDEKPMGDLYEQVIVYREELFLFPRTDEIVLCFRLEKTSGYVDFVVTDKLSVEIQRFPLSAFDILICDYTADLKKFFSFNIRLAKRVVLTSATLTKVLEELEQNPPVKKRLFSFDEVITVD